MRRALALTLVLMAPVFGGCLDWVPEEVREPINQFIDDFTPGAGTVYATEFQEGWNHDGRLMARVVHDEPLEIAVRVTAPDGTILEDIRSPDEAVFDDDALAWVNELDVVIEDGTWDVDLVVDGKVRKSWTDLRIDATPPAIVGLERVGQAQQGAYTIGSNYVQDPEHQIQVLSPSEALIATRLPHSVGGLTDGLHAYTILISDPAGNQVVRTVQVLAGNAKALPEGEQSAGVVARYTNAVRIWDISNPGAYLMPADASAAQPGYLGGGFGITPNDPSVQQVVADVVTDSMTSMDVALALFEWMYDNLEYEEARLDENDLLSPSQTFAAGGGVCRDLAAAYVSLLRAANVPARLVTGYLAGGVDGFHAWVEFYAGPVGNQGGWVPVDVSPIDGRWDEPTNSGNPDSLSRGTSTLLQSFGVRLPNYLPLRALPASAEVDGWATAISVSFSYPQGEEKPRFTYEKSIVEQADEEGVLCVNSDSLARQAAHSTAVCQDGPYDFSIGGGAQPFILQSTQIIDYGVLVAWAGPSTEVTVGLAVPFASEVAPVTVEHIPYVNHEDSPAFQPVAEGKRTVTLSY